MPPPDRLDLREIWYAALAEEFGYVCTVSDYSAAHQLLQRTRAGLHDPELSVLEITPAPDGAKNELWIVKRKPAPAGPVLGIDPGKSG
jgi:hypothetical protein